MYDDDKSRSNAVVGLVVLIIGGGLLWHFLAPGANPNPNMLLSLLSLGGPALTVIGGVMLVRGFFWGEPAVSGRTILYSGLIMLLFGAFPWIYTPMIIDDNGGEGSGMLGTFLFIFLGVPGLLMTIIGFLTRE